jgi:hypothetical protein
MRRLGKRWLPTPEERRLRRLQVKLNDFAQTVADLRAAPAFWRVPLVEAAAVALIESLAAECEGFDDLPDDLSVAGPVRGQRERPPGQK